MSTETVGRTASARLQLSARGLAHAVWQGRSVRAQLLLVVVLIELVAGLLGGAVTVIQARTSTRVEIAASMELAQLLVTERDAGKAARYGIEQVGGLLMLEIGGSKCLHVCRNLIDLNQGRIERHRCWFS